MVKMERFVRWWGRGGAGRALCAVAVVLLAAVIIQYRYMNEFPAFIHAWAQDDRYALAVGFLNNGFDFFHPETMIYNKQFPGWWAEASPTTVTAVDFPIHEYVVALLMKLLGTDSPWVFRGWSLLCSLVGLLFLYRLSFLLTRSFFKSLLVVMVTMTAPVYAYYFNGFIPSVPAFALAVAAVWAYVVYYRSGKGDYFSLGVALFTLAMLIRTTFAIPLIAVCAFELLRVLCGESGWKNKIPVLLIAAVCYGGWFAWNSHLRAACGSLFLNELMPPRSGAEVRELLADTWRNWGFQYFQIWHYLLFLLVVVAAVAAALRKKRVAAVLRRRNAAVLPKSSSSDDCCGREVMDSGKKAVPLWLLPAIMLFGDFLFAVAMMRQFPQHDYYFLDSFFLPIVLTFAGLLSILPNPEKQWNRITALIVVLALTGFMTFEACQKQQTRRKEGVEALTTAIRYKNANQMLEKSGYGSKDLRFLTLFSYPQNTPYVMMDREGYAVMWNDTTV
ncbi:MAG: glycosyltransferase family 39 protein, partial [Bacteroidales bacterium]|nr:glycosyltransferase family 39 protein [Bacteroidales bacterium]